MHVFCHTFRGKASAFLLRLEDVHADQADVVVEILAFPEADQLLEKVVHELVAAGRTFRLRMDLPKEMKGTRQVLFKAKVMWCKPDANPDFYNTGYRILNLSKTDARTIDGLIRDLEPENRPR